MPSECDMLSNFFADFGADLDDIFNGTDITAGDDHQQPQQEQQSMASHPVAEFGSDLTGIFNMTGGGSAIATGDESQQLQHPVTEELQDPVHHHPQVAEPSVTAQPLSAGATDQSVVAETGPSFPVDDGTTPVREYATSLLKFIGGRSADFLLGLMAANDQYVSRVAALEKKVTAARVLEDELRDTIQEVKLLQSNLSRSQLTVAELSSSLLNIRKLTLESSLSGAGVSERKGEEKEEKEDRENEKTKKTEKRKRAEERIRLAKKTKYQESDDEEEDEEEEEDRKMMFRKCGQPGCSFVEVSTSFNIQRHYGTKHPTVPYNIRAPGIVSYFMQ